MLRRYFYPRPPRGGRHLIVCDDLENDEFLSTPSARRATLPHRHRRGDGSISIHALREEGDRSFSASISNWRYFYPRPPRGGRPGPRCSPRRRPKISIHALREEGDAGHRRPAHRGGAISIHALREEGDADGHLTESQRWISIHALREEGDSRPRKVRAACGISIHALREEGDWRAFTAGRRLMGFLSTPSARRATVREAWYFRERIFLSTPSARRATCLAPCVIRKHWISIHALREEGDATGRINAPGFFISIHALREEGDLNVVDVLGAVGISIHALREEGDRSAHRSVCRRRNFYPRPPRGGRHIIQLLPTVNLNFYPRPPRGGRHFPLAVQNVVWQFLSTPSARRATDSGYGNYGASHTFLSTPSARRATAKTETKSLFSYKLYNILHEFRRALIYNGSKNYPNHAKRLENPVRRCRKDAENSPFAPGRKTQNNSRPSCSKGG